MSHATRSHDLEECRVEVVFRETFVTLAESIRLDDILGCSFVSYAHWEGTIIPALQTLE